MKNENCQVGRHMFSANVLNSTILKGNTWSEPGVVVPQTPK